MGIDPGKNGGVGLVDREGGYLDGWRWREGEDPLRSYKRLEGYGGCRVVRKCYLEKIELFRHLPMNIVMVTQSLLVNMGEWRGVLAVMGVKWEELSPDEWMGRYGLRGWRKRAERLKEMVKGGVVGEVESPLGIARRLWPGGALKHKADDGIAVGLLLADLARRDGEGGVERMKVQGELLKGMRRGRRR